MGFWRQDRAHGLPAADLNGLSDPYVTAQINDMDAGSAEVISPCRHGMGMMGFQQVLRNCLVLSNMLPSGKLT